MRPGRLWVRQWWNPSIALGYPGQDPKGPALFLLMENGDDNERTLGPRAHKLAAAPQHQQSPSLPQPGMSPHPGPGEVGSCQGSWAPTPPLGSAPLLTVQWFLTCPQLPGATCQPGPWSLWLVPRKLRLEASAWLQPGHPDHMLTLILLERPACG